MHAGYCTCPEHLAIQGGRWRGIRFPAMFALLEHERLGPMLFDTGYTYRFFAETRSFPNRLYRWLTPVSLREDELAINQLRQRGIGPQDITHVFISHFHADHIAGLIDFNCARFIYLRHAYDHLRGRAGWSAASSAFLPGLIPSDFETRSAAIDASEEISLPAEYAPFTRGWQLLGDESLIAVELPGHAVGQMGLFARTDERVYFFVADAAWLRRSIRENRQPHRFANLLFPEPQAYRATISALHDYTEAHRNVHVIPSHCEETLAEYAA